MFRVIEKGVTSQDIYCIVIPFEYAPTVCSLRKGVYHFRNLRKKKTNDTMNRIGFHFCGSDGASPSKTIDNKALIVLVV